MNNLVNLPQNRYIGGPKTNAGKEISKYNAIKHGTLVKLVDEKEFRQAKKLQNELINEYDPQTFTECILIETMCLSYIRRSRALIAEKLDNLTMAPDETKIEILSKTCDRYIVSCERQFYRALHELQRIQSARTGSRPTSIAMDVFLDRNE